MFARNLNLLGLKGQGESPIRQRPLILSKSLGMDLSLSIVHLFLQTMNGRERLREIQVNRQSKRVGVYRRHMIWMTVGLSTVPR